MYYSDLKREHSGIAQRAEQFMPTVMSVISNRLEEIQELFIRLNLNVSISGAERRNALAGPLPRLIRDLSIHEFFRKNATFPISRGQDLNLATKFLLMEQVIGFAAVKKVDLDRFVLGGAHAEAAVYTDAVDRATATLGLMTTVFRNADPLLSSQAQLTVYYWLVRDFGAISGQNLRHGLVSFEDARRSARNVAAERARGVNLPPADEELLRFNSLVRSPDDKAAQESMFTTLKKFLGS